MKHGSLFSGIGGFDLAAQWAGWDNIFQVEIDPFCRKVLKKNFPNVAKYEDIKEFDGKKYANTIDIISGGFPCQPFSVAGKQRGKKDDRYLWPEMLRVISEIRPTWIICENVAGIINMGLDQVLSDLENTGYTCQSFIIPACAKNAPHRRDRVWIVANRSIKNDRKYLRGKEKRQVPELGNNIEQRDVTHSNGLNGNNAGYDSGEVSQLKKTEVCGLQSSSDSKLWRCKQKQRKCGISSKRTGQEKHTASCYDNWGELWIEAATRLCRMDDGLPRRMDRVNRLKALGNAIVPQIVFQIMQAINNIEGKQ